MRTLLSVTNTPLYIATPGAYLQLTGGVVAALEGASRTRNQERLPSFPRDATTVAVLLQRPSQGAIAGAATLPLKGVE